MNKEIKYVASTLNNLENVLKLEIKEIINSKGVKVCKGRVKFNTKNINKFIKKTQSCNKVYSLIKSFNFKSLKDILNEVKKLDFNIKEDFVVRCDRNGKHDFGTFEVEKRVGEIIYEKGNKVNLKSENIIYIDIIDNECFIGNLIKKNLCKRDYRLRVNNKSINACLAYSLLRLSKVKKDDKILDVFCKDGVVLIEAYKFGIKDLYGFDPSENNIRNAKINSKLAKAKIKFSSYNIDWVSTKFKKDEVDRLISIVPYESKRLSKKIVEKELDGLFRNARRVIKKNITLITLKPKLIRKMAKKYKFKEILSKKVLIGEQNNCVLIFKK